MTLTLLLLAACTTEPDWFDESTIATVQDCASLTGEAAPDAPSASLWWDTYFGVTYADLVPDGPVTACWTYEANANDVGRATLELRATAWTASPGADTRIAADALSMLEAHAQLDDPQGLQVAMDDQVLQTMAMDWSPYAE